MIMKFKLWNNNSYTSYIFIGENLYATHQALLKKLEQGKALTKPEQKTLSKDIPSHLWLDETTIIFIDKMISEDDNINLIIKRLCVYLKPYVDDAPPEEIYTWIEKPILKSTYLIANFVSMCFQNNKNISYTDFTSAVSNYFNGYVLKETDITIIDKSLAFKLLIRADLTSIIEPIQFKYTYNEYYQYIPYNPIAAAAAVTPAPKDQYSTYGTNSYDSLTLQSFGKIDTINMILYKDYREYPYYFPYRSAKKNRLGELIEYIEDLDSIEKTLDIKTDNCIHKGYINFFQFTANEVNFNKKNDLGKAFDTFSTHTEIPFIKYKTYTNVYYKVDKSFLSNPDNYDTYWTKWTELTGLNKNYPDNTSLTFKLRFYKNSFCSFRIDDNFNYDVKFSIGKSNKTLLSNIMDFCATTLNKLIKSLRDIYPLQYIPDITQDIMTITTINSVDTISMEKISIKYDAFPDIIQQLMFPYFNIISVKEKNQLFLQYKKIDNYMKYDNITSFIMNKSNVDKNEVIQQLSKWFRIPLSDAEREYEKREGEIIMEMGKQGDRKFFKPKTDGFLNIKIKILSAVDMEFEISGFKYFETYDRIISLLKVLINLANKNVKVEGINIEKLEKGLYEVRKEDVIKLKDIDKNDILEKDIEPEYLDVEDKKEYEENQGEVAVDNELFKDFMDIVAEYKDAPDAAPQPEDAEDAADAAQQLADATPADKNKAKYFFKQLKDADKDLFDYSKMKDQPRRRDYSTLCSGRYPIVINKEQKNIIDKSYPKSYNNYLRVGSTPELAEKNYYICPEIWCPKSKVSMTEDQFNENNKQCPFEGEEAIHLKHSYWQKDSKRYIGVLDPYIHSKNFCLPCCFKHVTTRGKKRENLDICKKRKPDLLYLDEEKVEIVDEFDEELITGNPRYIKSEYNWPLQSAHYGLLPKELIEILGTRICGDRADGTGHMIIDKECYLRRGSSNKDQSFLACIIEILDNPDITSIKDFNEILTQKLSLERFISLENGKILKIFVNSQFSIFEKANFQEFSEWFIENKKYAFKFNLGKVYRSLLNKPAVFTKNIRHYQDIIREFMIYNGYKHYIAYINDTSQIKDHRILIDLINCEKEYINIRKNNIIIISIQQNKLILQCPFNRNNAESYNRNNPFTFILWNGKYYETMTKVKYNKEYGIDTRYNFYYKNADLEIKKLIDFACDNCLNDESIPDKQISDIEIATGLKAKSLVLDYGFKAKGILLNKNVYVPFVKSFSIFNLVRKRFIYYSDLINYKCKIDIKPMYTKLAKLNIFYKVKSAKASHILLENNIIIPINLKKEDIEYTVFEDDLEIFIGHEKEDERTNIIKVINENKKLFSVFLNSIITYINSNESILNEIHFLTDFKNPFPMNFKRKKLAAIMETIVSNILIVPNTPESQDLIDNSKDALIPCPDALWEKCLLGMPKEKLNEFVIKISEQILINHGFYFENRIKTFKYTPDEFLFEHHDIIVGKHKDYIKQIQDPFKILNERLDEEFADYIFKPQQEKPDYIADFIGKAEFKNNYDKFKNVVRNSFVVDVDSKYTNMYMYQLFECLYKAISSKTSTLDSLYLKNMVRTYMINDYETESISEMIQSKTFDHLWKEYKKKNKEEYIAAVKPPIGICETFFGSAQYYPSIYELRILSEFIGVNVIIFSRTSKNNESGLEFINNQSANYILMYHKYDSKLIRDIYELIVIDENKRKTILNRLDIKELLNLLKLKDIYVEIDVPVEDS